MADITEDLGIVIASLKAAGDEMNTWTATVNSIQAQLADAVAALDGIGARLAVIDQKLEEISLNV